MASSQALTTDLLKLLRSPPVIARSSDLTTASGFAKLFRSQLSPAANVALFGARSLRSVAFPANGSDPKSDSLTTAIGLRKVLSPFASHSLSVPVENDPGPDNDMDLDLDPDADAEDDPEYEFLVFNDDFADDEDFDAFSFPDSNGEQYFSDPKSDSEYPDSNSELDEESDSDADSKL